MTTAKILNANVTPDKLALSPQTNTVATSQTTTSASATDLATAGPSATVTVGANGLVLLLFSSNYSNSSSGEGGNLFYVVSGATTVSATTLATFRVQGAGSSGLEFISGAVLISSLNAGSNTIKLQYASGTGGTGSFSNRSITLIPL